MDVRTYLNKGMVLQALSVYGRKVVGQEIEDMIYHDLADKALWAAHVLQEDKLAKLAAQVVLNSGAYGEDIKKLASQHIQAKEGGSQ